MWLILKNEITGLRITSLFADPRRHSERSFFFRWQCDIFLGQNSSKNKIKQNEQKWNCNGTWSILFNERERFGKILDCDWSWSSIFDCQCESGFPLYFCFPIGLLSVQLLQLPNQNRKNLPPRYTDGSCELAKGPHRRPSELVETNARRLLLEREGMSGIRPQRLDRPCPLLAKKGKNDTRLWNFSTLTIMSRNWIQVGPIVSSLDLLSLSLSAVSINNAARSFRVQPAAKGLSRSSRGSVKIAQTRFDLYFSCTAPVRAPSRLKSCPTSEHAKIIPCISGGCYRPPIDF